MKWRFNFVFLVFAFIFLLVIVRLFYWQVVKADELTALAEAQYGRSVKIQPERGEIRTSDNFPIATNEITYLLYANPKILENKDQVALLLSKKLEIDEASVSATLNVDKFWIAIKSGVDLKTKEEIEKLKIEGIGFEKRYRRLYPEASMAAQLLGFVGKDDLGLDKGYFGVEGYYDRLLRGKEGKAFQIRDAFGRPILSRLEEDSGQENGSSLILSINRAIQFSAEKSLKEGIERYNASGGMVGIIEPKTGKIIALASYPSFDPREFEKSSEQFYKNPFITDTYEPGSTFKPVVMSSALNAKLVTPTTRCDKCSGPVSIGGYDIHTWNDKYFKNQNMIEVIQHSDNTGMVFVGQKLGLDRMIKYFSDFGFGKITGVDLQGEVAAQIKPRDSWYAVDVATASFGQGISVTPLQVLNAISTIANKGKRMEPHVVSSIESGEGKINQIFPKQIDQPISEETAKIMTEMMVNAVEKGEAKWTALKGYRVAGKTGTASIPVAGHYDPNQTIASFVGFGPVEDPRFAMIVIFDRPKTSIYGAETAAPVFFKIAKDIFSYYKIAPSN